MRTPAAAPRIREIRKHFQIYLGILKKRPSSHDAALNFSRIMRHLPMFKNGLALRSRNCIGHSSACLSSSRVTSIDEAERYYRFHACIVARLYECRIFLILMRIMMPPPLPMQNVKARTEPLFAEIETSEMKLPQRHVSQRRLRSFCVFSL